MQLKQFAPATGATEQADPAAGALVFILRYGYTLATVTPYCQAFVDAIKATFANGASDYRRDSRMWLFDEDDEPKVMQLIKTHFPTAIVKHFVSTDELISAV